MALKANSVALSGGVAAGRAGVAIAGRKDWAWAHQKAAHGVSADKSGNCNGGGHRMAARGGENMVRHGEQQLAAAAAAKEQHRVAVAIKMAAWAIINSELKITNLGSEQHAAAFHLAHHIVKNGGACLDAYVSFISRATCLLPCAKNIAHRFAHRAPLPAAATSKQSRRANGKRSAPRIAAFAARDASAPITSSLGNALVKRYQVSMRA